MSSKRVAKLRKSSCLLHVYFLEQEDDRIMKRVKAACICQTLHFMLKEDVGHDYAVKLANEEVGHYKKIWNVITHSTKLLSRQSRQTSQLYSRLLSNIIQVQSVITSINSKSACSHRRKSSSHGYTLFL